MRSTAFGQLYLSGGIATPLAETGYDKLAPEKLDRVKQATAAMHLLTAWVNRKRSHGCAFPLFDDASFVTGQAVVADGGWTAGHRMGGNR